MQHHHTAEGNQNYRPPTTALFKTARELFCTVYMHHNEPILPTTTHDGFDLPDVPAEHSPLGRAAWQQGLEQEVLWLLTQKASSIREEIYDRVDEILLRTTLEATGGNISQASHRLGISRPTLRSRLRQLKIEMPTS